MCDGGRVRHDECSDFLHILNQADDLSALLYTFADELRRQPGLPVSQTLHQEVTQLLLRFTTVRARLVAAVVTSGLGTPGLWDLHPEMGLNSRSSVALMLTTAILCPGS